MEASTLFAPPSYPAAMHDPGRAFAATIHGGHSIASPAMPSTRTTDPIVTGASVLAIRYQGGVAIAADTLASYGSLARYRDVRRIKAVGSYSVVGASGEYSDFQFISDLLDQLMTDEYCADDGARLYPRELWSYLVRLMYARRNKFDPLWNQLVVGGFRDGKSFLGMVDLHGTSYEDDTVATGYGAHIARPLMRKAYRPNLTEAEAKKILEDCMRVMFYRDARALDRIQIATISASGINVGEPFQLQTNWEFGRNVTH